jgi:hypothetical protein
MNSILGRREGRERCSSGQKDRKPWERVFRYFLENGIMYIFNLLSLSNGRLKVGACVLQWLDGQALAGKQWGPTVQ